MYILESIDSFLRTLGVIFLFLVFYVLFNLKIEIKDNDDDDDDLTTS